ncbi:hypothetical protein ATCC90586_009061 [Pythium insidiosum]|nr:hypothetical protein ATCC90586_009061 [Pythium insidiosum]
MPSRLDLEARLRALREPKAPAAAPSSAPLPLTASSRALGGAQAPAPATAPAPAPAVAVAAAVAAPAAVAAAAPPVSAGASGLSQPSPPVNMSAVLGAAYDDAVRIAQSAIDCERRRLVHTAIDGYIRAGQAFVALGRQQTAVHLQNVLKTKALALLQRAEGLEDWARQVAMQNQSSEALDAAYAASQQQEAAEMDEKEALVTKMRSENSEMMDRLNKLVLLTKMRSRLTRIVSDRRARKAAESNGPLCAQDAEGSAEEDREMQQEQVDGAQEGTQSAHASHPQRPSSASSVSSSPREEQKRMLINELHSLIGLPEITQLRHFKPLSEDAAQDGRSARLERELEEARREAEALRAAVVDMERSLRAAAETTRESSLKIEQEKDEDIARLKDELERIRAELDRERQLSSRRMSSADTDSERGSIDPDAIRVLGQGAYGRVVLVREKLGSKRSPTGALVCVKIFHSDSHAAALTQQNEIRLMRRMRHPNLIRFIDTFAFEQQQAIVMEFCSGGDLRAFMRELRTQRRTLTEDRVWYWFLQLTLALQYLHDTQHVLHRDVKTANIFLDNAGFLVLAAERTQHTDARTVSSSVRECPVLQPVAAAATQSVQSRATIVQETIKTHWSAASTRWKTLCACLSTTMATARKDVELHSHDFEWEDLARACEQERANGASLADEEGSAGAVAELELSALAKTRWDEFHQRNKGAVEYEPRWRGAHRAAS